MYSDFACKPDARRAFFALTKARLRQQGHKVENLAVDHSALQKLYGISYDAVEITRIKKGA